MKVLHIGLVSHFTDKMLYQDNVLSACNAEAGHDTIYISDTFCYKDGELVETDECDLRLDNGVRLIRIKYDWILNSFVTRKIQKAKRLVSYLDDIQPDAILCHGACGYELLDVSAYVNKRKIPFYIDSHASCFNTASTAVAKFAYRCIHGYYVKRALKSVNKVLYLGNYEKEFLIDMYHVPEEKLEYFPLGGLIQEKEEQDRYRKVLIERMGFPENAIICAHSGKMDNGKKTVEILRALQNIKDERIRLLIFGSIPDDMKIIIEPLIQVDHRVFFLGWKNSEEQAELLGATDLYLQPGTCSATAQIAMCDGCAVLLSDYYRIPVGDAAFIEENQEGIERVIREVTSNEDTLIEYKRRAYEYAKEKLDYRKLAERYLR